MSDIKQVTGLEYIIPSTVAEVDARIALLFELAIRRRKEADGFRISADFVVGDSDEQKHTRDGYLAVAHYNEHSLRIIEQEIHRLSQFRAKNK